MRKLSSFVFIATAVFLSATCAFAAPKFHVEKFSLGGDGGTD